MEARAIARHIRMSPRKVRLVVDLIRGRSVNEAVSVLKFSRKAAANAQDLADRDGDAVDVDELVISRAFVDEGPTLKRWKARAMGRASPRRRRTSHITVEVKAKES